MVARSSVPFFFPFSLESSNPLTRKLFLSSLYDCRVVIGSSVILWGGDTDIAWCSWHRPRASTLTSSPTPPPTMPDVSSTSNQPDLLPLFEFEVKRLLFLPIPPHVHSFFCGNLRGGGAEHCYAVFSMVLFLHVPLFHCCYRNNNGKIYYLYISLYY